MNRLYEIFGEKDILTGYFEYWLLNPLSAVKVIESTPCVCVSVLSTNLIVEWIDSTKFGVDMSLDNVAGQIFGQQSRSPLENAISKQSYTLKTGIMNADTPYRMKATATSIKGFDEARWEAAAKKLLLL